MQVVLSDIENCFQQHDEAARNFWRREVVFFWSAECVVEDLGSQLNRYHVDRDMPCMRSPETAETIADCCISESAKARVIWNRRRIGRWHADLRCFSEGANLTRLMSLSKFKFEFLSIVLSARLCFNLCPCLDGTQLHQRCDCSAKEAEFEFCELFDGELFRAHQTSLKWQFES